MTTTLTMNNATALRQKVLLGKDEQKSASVGELIKKSSTFLKAFIEVMLSGNINRKDIISSIDELSVEIESIFNFLAELKQVSDRSNLLALNVAIDAASAGEAGRRFAIVADEIRSLSITSNKLNEEIRTFLIEVQSWLIKARDLAGSIESTDVPKVMSGTSNVKQMMSYVSELESYIDELVKKTTMVNQGISDMIIVAIRNLQFEDIIKQTVDNKDEKVSALCDFINELTDDICNLENNKGGVKTSTMFNNLQKRIDYIIDELVSLPGRKRLLEDVMYTAEN